MPSPPKYFKPPFFNHEDAPYKVFMRTQTGVTHALDIRGWGYLTGKGSEGLALSEEEAVKVQNEFAEWVIDTLNRAASSKTEITCKVDVCESTRRGFSPTPVAVIEVDVQNDLDQQEAIKLSNHLTGAELHFKCPKTHVWPTLNEPTLAGLKEALSKIEP